VVLVDTCGAGKSTLGNFLLYGSRTHAEGFACGAGREAVTTTCRTLEVRSWRGATFKVLDTPGVSDSQGNTK
ncbi:unnamed protein product, partial [Laminaria digitata]